MDEPLASYRGRAEWEHEYDPSDLPE